MKKAAFFTLGCKVNQYETAALERLFEQAGYEIAGHREYADVYVVNSCTVTAEGDRKSRQALRRMRRQNPFAVICLCGCFPQAFPEKANLISDADIVMGAKNRAGLLEAVTSRLENGGRLVDISPHGRGELFEELEANRFSSRTRAVVKIEDGCEHFCAYCVIPRARGPVRSKPLDNLKAELASLAENGYREVVLAGINLVCYGKDIGVRFVDAVRAACETEGISRVRLGSLEPDLLSLGDIEELSLLEKLCPHFHLSLQSGCDGTLKRMGRRYGTAEYAGILAAIRAAFKNPAITTDIMVGFPGETQSEFETSLNFFMRMGFARAHVFAYSKRDGTRASEMHNQVEEEIKRLRSADMQKAASKAADDFLASQLGISQRVLFEEKDANGLWGGYSENYTPVSVESQEDFKGKILTVMPFSCDGTRLLARRFSL